MFWTGLFLWERENPVGRSQSAPKRVPVSSVRRAGVATSAVASRRADRGPRTVCSTAAHTGLRPQEIWPPQHPSPAPSPPPHLAEPSSPSAPHKPREAQTNAGATPGPARAPLLSVPVAPKEAQRRAQLLLTHTQPPPSRAGANPIPIKTCFQQHPPQRELFLTPKPASQHIPTAFLPAEPRDGRFPCSLGEST